MADMPEWMDGVDLDDPTLFPMPRTLRDWFAGQLLSGLHSLPVTKAHAEERARSLYMQADAMLRVGKEPTI